MCLARALFSQRFAPAGNLHLWHQNKTKENAAACRNTRPKTDRRPSTSLLNQLSSMPEGYSKLPRLLAQRQRTALGLLRNLDNWRLGARVRLELLDVVF